MMDAQEKCPIQYRVRFYEPATETAYVAGSWVRSYLSTPWARGLPHDVYFAAQSAVIAAALLHGSVLVAEHDTEEGRLLGYVVVERRHDVPVIHWCSVKKDHWGIGIARRLVSEGLRIVRRPGEQVCYSHWKSPADKYAKRKGWHFNPFLAHMRHMEK